MHQDYDKILKQNIKKSEATILEHVCRIHATDWQPLPHDVPRTIERRGDWLKIATDMATQTKMLYHIELQAANDEGMAMRMLLYRALYSERYKLQVEQYLIYLGNGVPTMSPRIEQPNLHFEYTIIAMNTIDYEVFLQSEAPESIILAILADFKKEKNEDVVKKILLALQDKTKNQQKLQRYIYQMEILSNLRNLQPVITYQIENMSINYDLTKDLRYIVGVEEGKEIGKAEGKEIGKEIGKAEGKEIGKAEADHRTITRMLQRGLDVHFIAETVDRPLDFVLAVQHDLLGKG